MIDHEWARMLEDTAWMDHARCAETDAEAFFPHEGDRAPVARAICKGCEVQAECLEWALTNEVEFGIWGGLSGYQRQRLAKKRRLGA